MMTKEELLERLNDIEWNDFEVKEASGAEFDVGNSERVFKYCRRMDCGRC